MIIYIKIDFYHLFYFTHSKKEGLKTTIWNFKFEPIHGLLEYVGKATQMKTGMSDNSKVN